MAVVTIKARARRGKEQLLREVRSETSRLLGGSADRVLVVYGPQDASIYYEPAPGQAPARPLVRV